MDGKSFEGGKKEEKERINSSRENGGGKL